MAKIYAFANKKYFQHADENEARSALTEIGKRSSSGFDCDVIIKEEKNKDIGFWCSKGVSQQQIDDLAQELGVDAADIGTHTRRYHDEYDCDVIFATKAYLVATVYYIDTIKF